MKVDFYVAAATQSEGKALARLGLWPIERKGPPDEAELDLAAGMSARLLYAGDARSPGDRVRGLQLENTSELVASLESFLRSLADRSPEEAAIVVAAHPEYWLGALKPRFSGDALRSVKLTTWRDTRGGVLKWSGLTLPEGEAIKPRLVLDRDATAKNRVKLTVRWSTVPELLAVGSVEYRVAMLAGEEHLAEVVVSHRAKPFQQATFSVEDFGDLEGSEKFEAFVEIAAVAVEGVASVKTEEFVLEFGQLATKTSAGSGVILRTLVEGALTMPTRDAFEAAVAGGASASRTSEDRKGYLTWKGDVNGRAVRVLRPTLIRHIEEDWIAKGGSIGLWTQRVRSDGSPVGPPQFVPSHRGDCEVSVWDRVKDATRKLSLDIGPFGLLARVHAGRWPAEDAYITAWAAALEGGPPELSLHGTIEVQSLSGRTLGLIVTTLHPLRFAWHSLYDRAVSRARYEEGLSTSAVLKTISAVDSAHFPFALPSTASASPFVFADVLGFHAVAMTVDGEPEPKAIVAALSACLGGIGGGATPSIGVESASVLAREIRHFLSCHQSSPGARTELLNVQAWRPGDGMTVARALGNVLHFEGTGDGDESHKAKL